MNKKGFTLIEILVIIGLLAILMFIAIPQLVGVVKIAKDNTYIEDCKNYMSALEEKFISIQFDEAEIRNGCYMISKGALIRNGVYADSSYMKLKPDAKGTPPTDGWVIVKDSSVTKGQLRFDNIVVNYDGGKATLDKKTKLTVNSACKKD